jgi:hypothetical protein
VVGVKEQTDSAAKARCSPIYVCGSGAINGLGGVGRYLVVSVGRSRRVGGGEFCLHPGR